MKNIFAIVLAFVLVFAGTQHASAAESADAVMKKAASQINSASGVSASFKLVSGARSLTGTLKASGKKFTIQTTSVCTWYDGKSMWSYNPGTHETTLMNPTASEVAEANPLSLVNTYAASFTAAFSKTQAKGSKTIVLIPKSKKLGYKSVHVTIPNGSYVPSVIVVIPSSGAKMTLSVSNVKLNQTIPASAFVYPKSKYPKAEVVDLR